MEIPIENIYYLLSYAWDKLEEKDKVSISIEDTTSLLDLLAKVLIGGTKSILRRGVDRSYVREEEDLVGVKGKIDMAQTLKRSLLMYQKASCVFDEFSVDILPNQILWQTMFTLIRCEGLDRNLRAELLTLRRLVPGISEIAMSRAHFRRVQLNRNNRFYGFLLNVCELVFDCVFPSEEPGRFQFSDFTRDERKMNQLFESFIRNYYTKEQNRFSSVGRESINWNLVPQDAQSKAFLPTMQTDITLRSRTEKVIIDAKYYRKTVTEHLGVERIHSGNLYQIFSYLMNQENPDAPETLKTTGILLYPKVEERDLNFSYLHGQHKVLVRTLDLSVEWREISTQLDQILAEA